MLSLADLNSRLPIVLQAAPKWVNLAFVIIIAYSLAQLTWRLLGPDAAGPAQTAAPRPTSFNRPPPDYAADIIRRHLFGQAQVTAISGTNVGSIDRPTSLPIKLLGVYATEDPKDALAIINTGQEEKVFNVGDSIVSGAILRQVLRDRVVIERNGVLEAVFLPKDESINLASILAAPLPVATLPTANGSGAITSAKDLRAEILNNPRKLREMADLEGAEQDGKFLGFRITSKGHDELFNQFGLQSGDIVTTVNGIALDAPEKGAAALRDLAKASDVTLVVNRNGSEIVIQRPLN